METEKDVAGLSLLPPIRRARGWRLYAENGRRFLDLWQDDGRGILGAKGTGLGTVAKAAIDRGLSSPLPSVWAARLEKAVLALVPGYAAARFFADSAAAAAALAAHPASGVAGPAALAPYDPARALGAAIRVSAGAASGEDPASPLPGQAFLWRPFSAALGPLPEAATSVWLRLPCPRALAPTVLLYRRAEEAPAAKEPVPPLYLAAAVKALAEYRGFAAAVGEEHWKRADRRLSRLFLRRGPYLFATCPREAYPALFAAALERGVLLSPDPDRPSLLPGDFDDGELLPLASLGL
jgi:hypothetical protein